MFIKRTLLIISVIILFITTSYLYKNTNDLNGNLNLQIDSKLPVLTISTDNLLPMVGKEYKYATFNYLGLNGSSIVSDDLISIRKRGNYTFNLPKNAYQLKFTEAINLLQTINQESNTWVLLADYNDTSLMRNYTALSFAKALDGLEYVVDFEFVELILNGQHQGTYLLTEQIEVSNTVVNIDTSAGDILFERKSEPKQDYTFYVESSSKTVAYDVRSEISSSEDLILPQEIVSKLETSLLSGDKQSIDKHLDIPSTIDFYIIQEIFKKHDFAGGSSFMYTLSSDEKLYFTTPWDFDWSAGNQSLANWPPESDIKMQSYENLFAGSTPDEYVETGATHSWFQQLMALDWFQEEVKIRYTIVLPDLYDAVIQAEAISKKYEFEFQRNADIWKSDEGSRNEHSTEFFDWMYNRLNWLNDYFQTIGF